MKTSWISPGKNGRLAVVRMRIDGIANAAVLHCVDAASLVVVSAQIDDRDLEISKLRRKAVDPVLGFMRDH